MSGTTASMALELARTLSGAPGYMAPCPRGSVFGLFEAEDVIRRPQWVRGRRSGALIFSRCGAACPVCDGFAKALPKDVPEATAAGAWTEYLRGVAGGDDYVGLQLRRLDARGMLPPGFFTGGAR